MKKHANILSVLISLIVLSCQPSEKKTDSKAQEIVDSSILAHGGKKFENSKIEFNFRDKTYGALRKGDDYTYARSFGDSSKFTHDLLINGRMTREINGKEVDLAEKMRKKYSNSINSVIYFAVLPFGLNDPAVIKQYLGEKDIKGIMYHKIGVSFLKNQGGDDYNDEYIYWINKETNTLDYLAYNYHTDGGGTRFREAYNIRTVNGIRFADYINYEGADQFEKITDYDDRFTKGDFKELSRVELTNIYVGQPDE